MQSRSKCGKVDQMLELENPSDPEQSSFSEADIRDLTQAKILLENPGLTARLASVVGTPLERGIEMLPAKWSAVVHQTVQSALFRALDVALFSIKASPRSVRSDIFHKAMAGASGGIGGAFGLIALPLELPFSTALILRSIADIARSEGHNLDDPEVKMSCLEVFAFGGKSRDDDAAEGMYWVVRAALGKAVSEAASYYVTQKGIIRKSAPAMVRLITNISARFGIIVSEQVAAKAVPVLGAAGGSAINILFMDHFQDMARGHFIVKRLERKHGRAQVEELYRQIAIPV
jgi:hypothetical protein